MLNVVIIMGRLTAQPEIKTTNSGITVCSFSVAVERSYQSGDEKQTDFINCVAWRNTAEFISKYFDKGQMIAIKGTLQQNTYTDKTGIKRATYEVIVNTADFCGNKQQNNGKNDNSEKNINYGNVDISEFEDISSSSGDLPF